MKYRCKKPFYVDGFDDGGFEIGHEIGISVGEAFQKQDDQFRLLGGSNSVRLTNENTWLEISEDTLHDYFEPVDEGGSEGK